jgi:hypothetical protein
VIKLTYCLRRKPGMTWDEFSTYWREIHAPLVAARAEVLGIKRYVQVRTQQNADLHARLQARNDGSPEPYDGIAELWYEPAERGAGGEAARTAARELLEDEPQLHRPAEFADLVRRRDRGRGDPLNRGHFCHGTGLSMEISLGLNWAAASEPPTFIDRLPTKSRVPWGLAEGHQAKSGWLSGLAACAARWETSGAAMVAESPRTAASVSLIIRVFMVMCSLRKRLLRLRQGEARILTPGDDLYLWL